MDAKHTPATPLPPFGALFHLDSKDRYITATDELRRRANAYPKQVQAGKELAQIARECIEKRDVSNVLFMDAVLRMEALLRELGEAE